MQHSSAAATTHSTDRTRPPQPSPVAQRPSATVLPLATDQMINRIGQVMTRTNGHGHLLRPPSRPHLASLKPQTLRAGHRLPGLGPILPHINPLINVKSHFIAYTNFISALYRIEKAISSSM